MVERKYRRIVRETLESYEYNIELVKSYYVSAESKKIMWLILLGLLETWDIVE